MRKIHVDQGKRYQFATHINDMLLPREQAESIEAFLVIIEIGQFTHRHTHDDTEQLFHVISGLGQAEITQPDGTYEVVEMAPGDVVFVPRGTEHKIYCTSTHQPLRYLCVDGFPGGKPAERPTWDDHYRMVIARQKADGL